jgi:acetyl-CoA carboxylase biotin carboxylase subunit
MTPSLRKDMGNAAIAFARAAKYVNAGTCEFLVDERGKFYFIEMNRRIQVEHPVTELVTGLDLIKEQIRIAAGQRLTFSQKDVVLNGWAIECRINAENPYTFVPSPGRITQYHVAGGPGIRYDSHVYANYYVPPYYDSLVGKLLAYGDTREQAIARMRVALSEMVIEGIQTNIPLHQELMNDAAFIRGGVSIHYLEEKIAALKSI